MNFALKLEVIFCVQGVASPLLSNIYLNEVDKMLERAKEATRYGEYTGIEYARFADDLVILIATLIRDMTGYCRRLKSASGRNWPLYKSRSMKRRVGSWIFAAAKASGF